MLSALGRTVRLLFTLPLCACLACTWADGGRLPGHLTLRLVTNPTTLDPALVTDVMGATIAAKLFNGLVRFGEDLAVVPDIARSWRVSADGRTYTFLLRNGVRFSTGREVTSADFRYSFERVLASGTKAPMPWVLDRIDGAREFTAGTAASVSGIRTPDERTLVLTLREPFGPFLSLLAMTTAYVVPREDIDRLGSDFGTRPVGTGPYVLVSWKHGQELLLARRDDHFAGSPRLRGIRYRVIPEDLTAVLEFETGRLDILQVPGSEYGRYRSDPRWSGKLFGRTGLSTYYIGMNCSRPPFNDRRVRQALNLAIDRRRILETLFEKRGELASGPVPPALWRDGRAMNEGYRYDPERARKLIAEAGATGSVVTVAMSADADVLNILEVVQEYLAKVGIKAEIRQLDWSGFKAAVNKGEFEAFWLSWWADYPDPENFLYPLFHSANIGPAGNKARYKNSEVDLLLERAQRTTDSAERNRLYRETESRIVRDAPWVLMWHRMDHYVVHPRVKDFRIYPIYSIDKGMDIGVEE